MDKVEEVKKFVEENNIDAEIIGHEKSGLTSENAAEAVGVSIENIVKTLLFVGKKKNVAVVTCMGKDRVDSKKLSEVSGLKKPRMARPEEMKKILGTEPGGTPPICLPENVSVFIDERVLEKEFVIGSAGSEFSGLKINPRDIVKFANAKIVDIKGDE